MHDDVVRHMTKHLVITHAKWYDITLGNHPDLEFVSCYNIISTLPITMEMNSKKKQKDVNNGRAVGNQSLDLYVIYVWSILIMREDIQFSH